MSQEVQATESQPGTRGKTLYGVLLGSARLSKMKLKFNLKKQINKIYFFWVVIYALQPLTKCGTIYTGINFNTVVFQF